MKAILFDFDGTLVDTQHLYNLAISKVLFAFNEKYTVDYCSNFFDGRCWSDAFTEISKEEGFDKEKIFHEGLSYAKELISHHVDTTTGVVEALEILQEKDIKYGICSNSHTDEIEFILGKTQLKKYFPSDAIFGRNLVQTGKPASDIYQLGLQKMCINSKNCFAVEDSINGATASINAGIKTFIFSGATSFGGEEKFKKTFDFPLQLFHDMRDIINTIVYAGQ
jgi:HAD superfamily hydrolase (TIGR01509 family)